LGVTASFHAGKLQADQVACLYNSAGTATRTPAQQTEQSVPEEIGMGASYFPGGLTISVEDMAKLTAILAGDGSYEGEQYLSPESVEEMETPQFTVTPSDRSPFQQCLILRRQEDLLGQSALYYHTGSAYGVYHVLSYNPDTRNGVVVFSIGAELQLTDRGLYAICSDLSQLLYEKMEGAV
jgi:CubicO group peptidase (beta-lactamase class C family)